MSRRLHRSTVLSTIILIINLLLINFLSDVEPIGSIKAEILNLYGYIILVWICMTWKKERKESLFSPYIIFISFFVIFNYGQPLLWAIGMNTNSGLMSGRLITGTHLSISMEQLNSVKVLTCFAMLSLHAGALLYASKLTDPAPSKQIELCDGNLQQFEIEKQNRIYRAMLFIGIVAGIISIPLTLYRYIYFYGVAMTRGYGAIYYNNDFSYASLTFIIEMFFFPSLLCILIGGKFNRKSQIFVWLIFAIYMFINLMMGDRGTWLYKFVILIWLEIDHYNIKIQRKILPYSIALIIGLYFVYAIVGLRDAGNITLDAILNNLGSVELPIFTAINEMGGSMKILAYMVVHGTSFWIYQNSYLTALLGMITSRFFSALGIQLVLVDDYFSSYLNLSYGTGFSMVGEAYMNFQYGYVIALMIFGYLFAMLFSRKNNNPLSLFVTTSSLSILVGWIRGSAYLYFKSFFFGVVVFYVAIKILSILRIRRS